MDCLDYSFPSDCHQVINILHRGTLSYLLLSNAVPTKAEDEAKKDLPVCIQRESRNTYFGAAARLLSDLPPFPQHPQSSRGSAAKGLSRMGEEPCHSRCSNAVAHHKPCVHSELAFSKRDY